VAGVTAWTDKKMKFDENGKFKILQLTDLHYSEGEDRDQNNHDMITNLLNYEKPDMVANTGDVVSGYNWNGEDHPWTEIYWNKFAQTVQDLGYYWASTAGNHDTQGDLNRE
jgi:predicted MPP superfamily phosphohydrolase